MSRARWALAGAIPALLVASAVFADRPRVVMVAPAYDDPAVTRMRGELAVLGVEVEVLVSAKDSPDLPALAKRLGASAALRVERTPPAIVVWVEPGAGVTPGEVRVGGPAESRDAGLLALRAVEVLRARLLRVPITEAPPAASDDAGAAAIDAEPPVIDAAASTPVEDASAPVPAPPADAGTTLVAASGDTAAPAKRPDPRPFAISAGPAVLLSPGGVPPSVEVRVAAEWDPIPRLGVEASAFLPATAGTVSATEGSMSLRAFDVGAGLRGFLTDPLADFTVALGAGVSAMLLSFEGRARDPWSSASGSSWAVAPYLTATAAYRVHTRVALRLDLEAALVRPQPVLRIAGNEVASFGQPAFLPSLGVEVRP